MKILDRRWPLKAFSAAFRRGQLAISTLQLLKEVLPALEVREDRLKGAMTEDLYVTDEVYKLVAKGKAFREAYQEAKEAFFKRKAEPEALFTCKIIHHIM